MTADVLKSVGLDRYDLNARLRPALLTLLPVFVVAAFWLPPTRSLVAALVSLLGACGLLYFLAQIARRRGRAAECRLGDRAGRLHSARLLTYVDPTFAAPTKARYHQYFATHGVTLSSAAEEQAAPDIAFDRARSAVDWLLESLQAGSRPGLLFEENIAYGFQRNLLGLKPIALGLAVLCLGAHAILLQTRPLTEAGYWTGVLIGVVIAALFVMWLLFVSADAVTDASLAFARRLLARCEAAAAEGGGAGKKDATRRTGASSVPLKRVR